MSPIAATDVQFRLSGGAANANVNASLGGAMSSTGIVDAIDNNLFDDVTGAESAAGDVEYRGVYIRNNDGTRPLVDVRLYISSPTSSPATEIDIGVAAEGMNVDMASIANEQTAPPGVTFSRPADYASGLQLNGATGLTPGSRRGVWVRRTVNAAAPAYAGDTTIVKVEGDSAA